MSTLSYPVYDTALFGVAASVDQALFKTAQGGDATHTKSFTNARGAGQFPQNEKFTLDRVGVYVDFNLTEADAMNVWALSVIELRVNDETQFQVPLRVCAYRNDFGGHFTQTAAANRVLAGLAGDGFILKNPVTIPGGTAFVVNVFQGTALSAANIPVRCVMFGDLERGN